MSVVFDSIVRFRSWLVVYDQATRWCPPSCLIGRVFCLVLGLFKHSLSVQCSPKNLPLIVSPHIASVWCQSIYQLWSRLGAHRVEQRLGCCDCRSSGPMNTPRLPLAAWFTGPRVNRHTLRSVSSLWPGGFNHRIFWLLQVVVTKNIPLC